MELYAFIITTRMIIIATFRPFYLLPHLETDRLIWLLKQV